MIVVRPGALGDVLLLRPALHHAFRHGGVRTILIAPGARGRLLENDPWVDGVVDLDGPAGTWLHGGPGSPPDRLADGAGDHETAVAFMRPDVVVEERLRRLGVSRVVFHPDRPGPDGPHAAIHLRQGMRTLFDAPPMDVAGATATPPLPTDPTRSAQLPGGPVALLHPGSGSAKKNWPVERFAELGRLLAKDGFAVVVAAGEADGTLGEELSEAIPDATLLGPLALPELAAALASVDAHVGNDSGVSHLAAAVGTPTVAVFGPTDPRLWAPVGRRVTVVRGDALFDVAHEQVRRTVLSCVGESG